MAASASDAHPFPIYNARFRVVFPILNASGDLVSGAASLDSELSQDSGTFTDATNEATEIATSSGVYFLDLIATELDTKSTAGIVKTATSGAKTTPFTLYPMRLPVIRTGTAQAGAASTITLDAGASTIDDYYVGCYVNITNNSPSNALGQARRITGYVGSTKVATVEGTYGTNPSSASTFEVLATEGWAWRRADLLASGGVATTQSAGRPEVNASHVAGTSQTAADIGSLVAKFTGLTSLAQWLGAIAGKQTGNSTARTEIRATGAGSGSFDETTDSQEALRDNMGTPQTGDTYARVGAPVGASLSVDLAAVKTQTSTIDTRLPAALTGAGNMKSDSLVVSDKTGYALTSGERTAIANEVEAQIIDETDSEKVLTAITDKIASVNPSLDDLTLSSIASAIRTELSVELARIDAAISSRLATGGYTAPPSAASNATAVRTELVVELGRIDAAVSSRLATGGYTAPPSAADNATQVRTELTTELGRLDAAVSTRLASGSYSAPPSALANASAVRTELTTELGRVDASISSRATPAQVLSSITGMSVESDITLVEAVRVILSAVAGELSGAGDEEMEFTRGGGGKVRITATVDGDGNRLAVLLDGTP